MARRGQAYTDYGMVPAIFLDTQPNPCQAYYPICSEGVRLIPRDETEALRRVLQTHAWYDAFAIPGKDQSPHAADE